MQQSSPMVFSGLMKMGLGEVGWIKKAACIAKFFLFWAYLAWALKLPKSLIEVNKGSRS